MDSWLIKGRLEYSSSQPIAVSFASDISENSLTHGREESSPKKLGKAGNEKRKYDKSYLSLAFIDINNLPYSVLCNRTFSNSVIVPVKLLCHFKTNHTEFKEKGTEYFKCRRDQLFKIQKLFVTGFQTRNEKVIVLYWLEKLVKPCTVGNAECMLDEKSVTEITLVPLSNNTVTRRIKELAANKKTELISRLQNCTFGLQTDESTDVARLFFFFVQYQHQLTIEDILLCKFLPTNTTGAEIFNVLNNVFESHGLSWNNYVDICIDGG
ncbi:zinc finger BED domain-containing protein 5-like [Tachypleus tridentatus]|uniref:zinc finger BED domain-containing protein 5-like n=1 Tax=Tachypleus tridentatus TaxID=6853 RepID=UPI003FD6B5F2